MKGRKIVGVILFIIGIIILILTAAADFIGVGPLGSSPGFGLQQTIGLIVGAVIAIVGAILLFKK